jgi:hypothetical protein
MNKHELGDAPNDPRFREAMVYAMEQLDILFNQGKKAPHKTVGIVMLVFPYGDQEGRCNYISNGADRRDICTMFREQIKRFEGQPEMKSEHKQ